MIKSITITNYKDESFYINMFSSSDSGLNIRKIDGLGPVKANINTTPIVTGDGAIYNSARAENRNIVITLGFVNESNIGLNLIEDVRLKSYKMFPLKSMVKFEIETDRRNLYTYGYVESNEPDIFSQDETAQISIICPNAYFTSKEKRDISLNLLRSTFKFPFEVIEEKVDGINIMLPDIPESITVVNENGDGIMHSGNIAYSFFEYDIIYEYYNRGTTYEDLSRHKYSWLLNILND